MLVWPAPVFLISHLQIKILSPSKAEKLPSAQLAACCSRGVRRPWQGHGSTRKSQGGRQPRPGKACTCRWASALSDPGVIFQGLRPRRAIVTVAWLSSGERLWSAYCTPR